MELILLLNTTFAAGSLLLLALAAAILCTLHPRYRKYFNPRHVLVALSATAVIGSGITLLYSEVFGFIPCGLCWLERTMLYPQAIILPIAAWMNDRSVYRTVLLLSLVGAAIALYHHGIQIFGGSFLPCPASGNGDCAKRLIFEFGFVTFPFMAFALFVFNATLSYVALFISRAK